MFQRNLLGLVLVGGLMAAQSTAFAQHRGSHPPQQPPGMSGLTPQQGPGGLRVIVVFVLVIDDQNQIVDQMPFYGQTRDEAVAKANQWIQNKLASTPVGFNGNVKTYRYQIK